MNNYLYTAKDFTEEIVTGSLPAEDERELYKILKNKGLFLTKAVLEKSKNKKRFDISFEFKVSATEKIMFTRNLSIMIATGMSLVKSFDVLANQAKSKKLKDALFATKEKINKGESMSSALSSYPDIFSEFFLSMIKIGEESGTVEEVLKVLSLQLEKEHKLKSEVQSAMIYPAIVLSLLLVVGMIVDIVVLPKLKIFFVGMGADIPFYTRMIIDFGDFSARYWFLLAATPIVLIFILLSGLKTKTGKRLEDTILLKLPVVSSLVKKNNCAVLIRALSSLLSSGVSLTRSLEVLSGVMNNSYFKNAIEESLDKVKKGQNLSAALDLHRDIFPYGAIEMIEVGEETGKTSTVLKTLADFYEEEVIAATSNLSAILEPVLIIFLGLVVGLFAFSIIGPMYSSLGAIH